MQSLEELSREIESIRQEIREGAAKFATPEAFYEFRKSFLDNKAGKIGHLMKEMRNVPKEDKAAYGKNVNVLRDWAQEHFKDMVFKTIIQRSIRLSEAPSHGKPIILYDVMNNGTANYLNLAKEVLERNGLAPTL